MNNFRCRICSTADYTTILEGTLPLAVKVCGQPSNDTVKYPLHVVCCSSCGHIQLRESVDAELYDDYLFTPSYTAEFEACIKVLCGKLNDKVCRQDRKCVLEIGSGNGFLLKRLKESGWNTLGVEPSAPMVSAAKLQGVDTIHSYFEEDILGEIQKKIGKPNVVILRHVLEHLDRLNETITLIRPLLEDGLLVIEVPYVKRTIQEKRFYDFYHEHLSYFSVTALNTLLSANDFHIHEICETLEGGGSVLIFADRDSTSRPDDNVDGYLEDEKSSLSAQRMDAFSKGVSDHISHLKAMVGNAKSKGKTVAGWGAGQRGCTLIAHCGLQSDSLQYVIDANKNYWWRYIPGTDIQIVPPNYYQEHMVDSMFIFATGYADSIIQANPAFEQMGGSFIKISSI